MQLKAVTSSKGAIPRFNKVKVASGKRRPSSAKVRRGNRGAVEEPLENEQDAHADEYASTPLSNDKRPQSARTKPLPYGYSRY